MTDNKLTDKEIVKAYEFCLKNKYCTGCIADTISKTGERDCKLKPQDITDLINRLQAEVNQLDNESSALLADIDFRENEINRLRAENEVYETCNARKDEAIKFLESRLKKLQMQFDDISKLYSEIKTEAYKEFAEKLKKEYSLNWLVSIEDINNLYKELVGEDK